MGRSQTMNEQNKKNEYFNSDINSSTTKTQN